MQQCVAASEVTDPIHSAKLEALLETADREMYERKRARTDSSSVASAANRVVSG